jgi:dTDP-glucose 4,6-dehydratase
LIKVFKRGKLGENYNIGSNKNVTNIEITKSIMKIAKKKIKLGKNVRINFVNDRPGHDYRYALSSKKIIEKLNWKPKTNIKKGIMMTVDWYLNNKSFYKSFSKNDMTKRFGKL